LSDAPAAAAPQRQSSRIAKLLPWVITLACFALLYTRIDGAARRQGSSAFPYLMQVFEKVDWWSWLALMLPYSVLFFLVDSLVIWRVVNWFNTRISYRDILPVRASTYILSILNEQIGKGVMAYYLNRRDGVPGWQVGSSMLFVMFCEFYYLLSWACVGAMLRWDRVPEAFRVLPWVALGALAFFVVWVLYFRGVIAPTSKLRERDMLRSFRLARPWHYAVVVALRSPALLAAAFVYSRALGLFGIESGFLEMLGVLPLIFFGAATPGPMRAVAILMWTALYPEHPAEMAAFGLVMHNFFVLFNAAIGLVFLRRANRELFAQA
jgi:hypothetical protein